MICHWIQLLYINITCYSNILFNDNKFALSVTDYSTNGKVSEIIALTSGTLKV